MSDIAERLRQEEPRCGLCNDLRVCGAEEIERLRALKPVEEIERLRFVLEAFREALREIAGERGYVLKKETMQARAVEALTVEREIAR
jgi:hypothetical protein